MERRAIEILAPAGGAEALRAAVFTGADAVYLGGKAFGARASAENFTDEQLLEAVKFCHARAVKVYVTVNTLLKDSELDSTLSFVKYLCDCGVDAVIIQDMGLYRLLRETAPLLKLHASTQTGIHSVMGVRLMEELGINRVVLARELSKREITEISQGSGAELEVFVHGAHCMSVSGQCYFSSMLGSRSGNRGMCAQPCRLPFSAPGGTGYDLSLRDLSLAGKLRELSESGVCSAKIEGRMKRPEYVAAAVSACRSAADGELLDDAVMSSLAAVFSRSGFTDGYFKGERGRGMFGIRTKEDALGASRKLLSGYKNMYKAESPRIPVDFLMLRKNNIIRLEAADSDGNMFAAKAEVGGGEALPLQRCIQQLSKTGGTPFYAGEIRLPEAPVNLTISGLNSLRREALEGLLRQREEVKGIPFSRLKSAVSQRAEPLLRTGNIKNTKKLTLWGSFRLAEQIPDNAGDLERILLPLNEATILSKKFDPDKLIIELPRLTFDPEEQMRQMEMLMDKGFRRFACGSFDSLALCRQLNAEIYGSFGLNITNSRALEMYADLGLSGAELSFELKKSEVKRMAPVIPKGLMLYGRSPLMLTRNCPISNGMSCKACMGGQSLTDRKQIGFPVRCTGKGRNRYTEVFNSLPLYLLDENVDDLGLSYGILRFTVENSVETGGILESSLQRKTSVGSYTRGLFHRGVN